MFWSKVVGGSTSKGTTGYVSYIAKGFYPKLSIQQNERRRSHCKFISIIFIVISSIFELEVARPFAALGVSELSCLSSLLPPLFGARSWCNPGDGVLNVLWDTNEESRGRTKTGNDELLLGGDDEDALLEAAWRLWRRRGWHALPQSVTLIGLLLRGCFTRLSGVALRENERLRGKTLFYCIDVLEVGQSTFPVHSPCC